MLNVCISDAHKLLLLNSTETAFIDHCVAGLMLDTEVRADVETTLRATAMRNYAEVFQQVALFEPGRDALVAEEKTVRPALEAVLSGTTWGEDPQGADLCTMIEEAKNCAENALSLLFPQKQGKATDEKQKASEPGSLDGRHIMMSYQWAAQDAVLRIVAGLKRNDYLVWVDVPTPGNMYVIPSFLGLFMTCILPGVGRTDAGEHHG